MDRDTIKREIDQVVESIRYDNPPAVRRIHFIGLGCTAFALGLLTAVLMPVSLIERQPVTLNRPDPPAHQHVHVDLPKIELVYEPEV